MEEKLINHLKMCFEKAEENNSKVCKEILSLEGMSGHKTRHFYNNLLEFSDARYLEIGVYHGSSTCSAMYKNKAVVLSIDNWSEFGNNKKHFLSNVEKFKGENKFSFIEQDCYKVDTSKLQKFNIFMYDGNHTEESQFKALNHYINNLDNTFIFIVDDWNWEQVRTGTYNSIRKLNLKVLYDKEIRLTNDNTHTPREIGNITWWNGIYAAVLQKE